MDQDMYPQDAGPHLQSMLAKGILFSIPVSVALWSLIIFAAKRFMHH